MYDNAITIFLFLLATIGTVSGVLFKMSITTAERERGEIKDSIRRIEDNYVPNPFLNMVIDAFKLQQQQLYDRLERMDEKLDALIKRKSL